MGLHEITKKNHETLCVYCIFHNLKNVDFSSIQNKNKIFNPLFVVLYGLHNVCCQKLILNKKKIVPYSIGWPLIIV